MIKEILKSHDIRSIILEAKSKYFKINSTDSFWKLVEGYLYDLDGITVQWDDEPEKKESLEKLLQKGLDPSGFTWDGDSDMIEIYYNTNTKEFGELWVGTVDGSVGGKQAKDAIRIFNYDKKENIELEGKSYILAYTLDMMGIWKAFTSEKLAIKYIKQQEKMDNNFEWNISNIEVVD